MNPSNKEMQLRKTCELYAYVLASLDQEVPYAIQECADSYDYPVECAAELAQVLKELDSDSFERIVNDPDSTEARNLSYWWQMQQEAERLRQALIQTCL
jgi:hypothetical protein